MEVKEGRRLGLTDGMRGGSWQENYMIVLEKMNVNGAKSSKCFNKEMKIIERNVRTDHYFFYFF